MTTQSQKQHPPLIAILAETASPGQAEGKSEPHHYILSVIQFSSWCPGLLSAVPFQRQIALVLGNVSSALNQGKINTFKFRI